MEKRVGDDEGGQGVFRTDSAASTNWNQGSRLSPVRTSIYLARFWCLACLEKPLHVCEGDYVSEIGFKRWAQSHVYVVMLGGLTIFFTDLKPVFRSPLSSKPT